MDIGHEIKMRRQELRLTQQALADMSGVSVRMIKSIEGNYANPSIRTVEKLLVPLGLHIEIIENNRSITRQRISFRTIPRRDPLSCCMELVVSYLL